MQLVYLNREKDWIEGIWRWTAKKALEAVHSAGQEIDRCGGHKKVCLDLNMAEIKRMMEVKRRQGLGNTESAYCRDKDQKGN